MNQILIKFIHVKDIHVKDIHDMHVKYVHDKNIYTLKISIKQNILNILLNTQMIYNKKKSKQTKKKAKY